MIIDEAHTQHKVWTDFIQNTKAACIGLSATPFSPGLAKLFTNLINATTMHELTQSGVLVPMRVMSCKKVDMTGAATSGGEWTDEAAAARGMEIVGERASGSSSPTTARPSSLAPLSSTARNWPANFWTWASWLRLHQRDHGRRARSSSSRNTASPTPPCGADQRGGPGQRF